MANPTLAAGKMRLAPGRVPIRFRLLLGFAVPLTVWILVSVLNITVWSHAVENGERLIGSQRTILLANEYISASLHAQSSKRGFLMTSDPVFLETYYDAIETVARIHSDLATQVRNQPEQLKRLQNAGNLFQRWVYDISRQSIDARRSLPLGVVQETYKLQRLLLVLQDAQLRTPGNGTRAKAITQIRLVINSLLQQKSLAPSRSVLQRALGELDEYEQAFNGTDADLSAKTLRDFIATITREIQALLDRDENIRHSITEDTTHSLLDEFHVTMNRFIATERVLLEGYRQEMSAADERSRFIFWAGPALGLMLMAIMTSWMSRRIARSLEGISRAARGLARGDLRARARVDGSDEFAELAERFNVMAELVESRSSESAALAELGEMLQSSTSIDEAARIFAELAMKLFPGQPGGLYLVSPSRDEVVAVTFWKDGNHYSEAEFLPEDCWALRLSRAHESGSDAVVRCAHLLTPDDRSVCLPLHAFGETLGVLFVNNPENGFAIGSIGAEQHREFIDTVAEQLALALANLRMRETLRHQSIRDPLTQLYNRRYLDETFRRELHRAGRRKSPLSVLTFDIDHFKRFNDTHGHDGGDALLKAVGNSLRDFFRAEDGAFRAGGEEFVAVLPETTLEDAVSRAEELRSEIASLEVQHGNLVLPAVTISIGVAAFPQHGETTDQLLKAADRALYKAKESGRNRVVAAE